MTAKTFPEALALEADRGAQYRAEIWRAGYAAGLDAAAATVADALIVTDRGGELSQAYTNSAARKIAKRIRTLSIPEMPR